MSDTKKIGLITTQNANNYGAALQCYATRIKLDQFGTTAVINYDNRHVGQSLDHLRFAPTVAGIKALAKDLLRIKPRRVAIGRFHTFARKYFNLTDGVAANDLERTGQSFDYYISGSDQIWNPACVSADRTLDTAYFLEFGRPGAVFAAYASSWGGYKFNPYEQAAIKGYLAKYAYISVRESDSRQILADLTGQQVTHVCDPTLLLTGEEWRAVAAETGVDYALDKYLLVYSVPKNPKLIAVVKTVAAKLGLDIVVVDQDPLYNIKGARKIMDAGPLEFIKLFSDASFVVTDSFHGTCFSTIFRKPFLAVTEAPHSNRIESLLNVVGLEDRIVKDSTAVGRYAMDVDYTVAGPRLEDLRKHGFDFIASIFEK